MLCVELKEYKGLSGFSNKSKDEGAAQDPLGIGNSAFCRRIIVPRVYFFGSTVSFIALPTRNFRVVFAGI